jgi:PST family polysaccharide transporter
MSAREYQQQDMAGQRILSTGKTVSRPAGRDLKSDVTSGLGWTAVGRAAQQIVQFGLSVVLARLLSPKDYGLMAMSMVFTGFAGMLADAGFNTAIVQRKELKESHTHTVFWMTFGSGLALTLITFVLSPWLADFFKAPSLKPIFRVIALNFIFGGIGNVPSALLQRRMQFRRIATIDVSSLLLSGIVGVVMAFVGAGVWSLVGQSVSASLLTSALRCISCRWLPKTTFCRTSLKEIWSFSGNLYGFNFINYWARNADNLLVGKFLGAPSLGIYNRAYALMLLPITQINSVVAQVIFPAFSSIQDDKERVKRIYLRGIAIVALLVFPMMAGLALVAEPFVRTVYGEKWIAVVPLLQIMSCLGATQALVNSTGWIYLSTGRTQRMFYCGTCSAIVVILSFVAGIISGSVVNLAWLYAVANILLFWPGISFAGQVIGMRFREVAGAVQGSFFAACGMAVGVALTQLLLPTTMLPWLALILETLAGAVVYLSLAATFKLKALQDVITLLSEGLKSRSSKWPKWDKRLVVLK